MSKLITLRNRGVALVDDESFEFINQWGWSCSPGGYAERNANKRTIYMHRILTNCPEGMVVDHINKNKLDNRLENLRVCTHAENMRNRGSQRRHGIGAGLPKGVSRTKEGRFRAQIWHQGRGSHIGTFQTADEAAIAYDAAAIVMFGEFGVLNFPPADHGEQP